MLSDNIKSLLRKSPATLCAALSVALFFPPVVHSAGEPSYAGEIRQYVAEDKVYLLEKIRQKVILPGEKLVIDALLSEDGPQAMALYQKQLSQYPDPVLDQISTARIAAYTMAKESIVPLPKFTMPEPAPKPRIRKTQSTANKPVVIRKEKEKTKPEPVPDSKPPVPPSVIKPKNVVKPFALQCGSFKSKENAETLAKKISEHTPAKVIQQGEHYRVMLKNGYSSKEDAVAAATKLPFETVVVHAQ